MPTAAPSNPPAVNEIVGIGERGVPLRIHLPEGRPATGAHLEIHGGGFYMGSAAADDIRNRLLAGALGIAVASVDDRLAPAPPWPAAPDDCETAALLARRARRETLQHNGTGSPPTRHRWHASRSTTSRPG